MAMIFGIGIGIVILSLIWFLAIAACLVLSRNQGPDGAIAPTLVAAIVTLILVFFPREAPKAESVDVDVTVSREPVAMAEEGFEIFDSVFIPRTCLIVFMFICLIAGLVALFLNHCTHKIEAKAVSSYSRR